MLNKLIHAVAITLILSILAQVSNSESAQPAATLRSQSFGTVQPLTQSPDPRYTVFAHP